MVFSNLCAVGCWSLRLYDGSEVLVERALLALLSRQNVFMQPFIGRKHSVFVAGTGAFVRQLFIQVVQLLCARAGEVKVTVQQVLLKIVWPVELMRLVRALFLQKSALEPRNRLMGSEVAGHIASDVLVTQVAPGAGVLRLYRLQRYLGLLVEMRLLNVLERGGFELRSVVHWLKEVTLFERRCKVGVGWVRIKRNALLRHRGHLKTG